MSNSYTIHKQNQLNESLIGAVAKYNYQEIVSLLSSGADPNYTQYKDEDEPMGYIQPTTPLRMVLFRISDCMLEDEHLRIYKKITELLLKHGADCEHAIPIITSWYEYLPKGLQFRR